MVATMFMLRMVVARVLPALAVLLPLSAAAQPVAIVGGKIHPVSGPVIEQGTVVIVDGKITAVGAAVTPPAGARVIDAKGKWVTPGLINAVTALGVSEVGSLASTNDGIAQGEAGVAAAFRVWEGLNPASVLWAPTRNEGITSALSLPTGGLVSGQAAFVDTAGATRAEIVRKAPVAMLLNFGGAAKGDKSSRGELLLRIRQLFDDARSYATRKLAYERAGTRPFVVGHLHLQALQLVLDGRVPLLVSVDRASDIQAMLDLAGEYKLRLAILGGVEAWKVAAPLAAAKVPVLTAALDNIPASFDELGARQENAAILQKAGVPVVLTSGSRESFNVRNVKQHAGNAVAYGLPWAEALRAVTLTPAEVFGVSDAVGSIAVGKDANVVVWSGDPFEFSTRVEHVLIRGREVQAPSRQDLLSERYKTPGKR
jgi:imidazolonepropionase-like amidohydrolase